MSDFDPIPFLETAVGIPSHESVDDMRDFLVETISELGYAAAVDEAGNVVASTGTGDPHLVLNTHIDTVPPHVPPRRSDGRLHGRGACDAKGPLAALLSAFVSISPGNGRVTLAVTPDEERYSTGAAALELDPDAVIVGEPTGLAVCHAARGRFQGTVTVSGRAAHAAEPEAGTNAIVGAGPVLAALGRFDTDHRAAPDPHPELGPPTLTPTMIEGGEAANQIPATCRITIDRRSIPPETADEFREALNEFLATTVPDVSAEYAHVDRPTPFLEAFQTDPETPIVESMVAAGAGPPEPFRAATEASYFATQAPTIVFGPGSLFDDEGAVAHARREYVEFDAVERAADILVAGIETFFEESAR